MTTINGFIISLPEAAQHRQRLQSQIDRLEPVPHYGLFTEARPCSVDDVHILEDDAEMSRPFWRWARSLPNQADVTQIILTDMYAIEAIFAQLLRLVEDCRKRKIIGWIDGYHYSGCTSSWLIHRDHPESVNKQLNDAYRSDHGALPLDNASRRLIHKGRLRARVVLPFLTSVDGRHQLDSDRRKPRHQSQRALETVFRRRLSLLSRASDLNDLGTWLAETLAPSLRQLGAMRYRYDPRLLNEPGNSQTSLLSSRLKSQQRG